MIWNCKCKLLFKDKIYIYLLIKEITVIKVDNLLLMNQTCTWLFVLVFFASEVSSNSAYLKENNLNLLLKPLATILIEGENDEFKMELFDLRDGEGV